MKNRTIIFDATVDGHHLEYIHHLFLGAREEKDEEYIFVLPIEFKNVSCKLTWPPSYNITIEYISDENAQLLRSKNKTKAFYLCKILTDAVLKHNASNVFLISLMEFMPFLPFFLRGSIKVSGILYLIYLYRWKNASLKTRFFDVIKYLIFSKSKIFKNIYLLNDNAAPIYINKKFNTSVFKYLPDPFIPIPLDKIENLRKKLNISSYKIVCLHFGALTDRKGTIEILRSILDLEAEVLSKLCFIFAGKVSDQINTIFYSLIHEIGSKTQIIVYDKFCDYDFIGSLCVSSNFLIIPYKNTEFSSGVLGYASQFCIPVVGPRMGLLGKLIRKNRLGYLLESGSRLNLSRFFEQIDKLEYKCSKDYCINRSVSNFTKIIFRNEK